MNLPFFIARRLAFSGARNFSGIIIRIAIAAVALSVAVMISASALISGFKYEISKKIFEFWGHIHISDTAYSLSFEPQPIAYEPSFMQSLLDMPVIDYSEPETILGFETGREAHHSAHGRIGAIQTTAHKPGIIRTKTAMEGILLKGIGGSTNWEHLKPYMIAGSMIGQSDSASGRPIIISKQTADRLEVGVNDKFTVYFVKEGEQLRRMFRVSGIYKTGLEEYDRKIALCDIGVVQELLGWDSTQIGGYELWLDDIRDMDLYTEYLYSEVLPDEMICANIREKFPAIFEWLQLQDYNEVVILVLMLIVAIINMITALLVLVLERSNMIGVLKALGAPNARVSSIFLYHAGLITVIGMFIGNLLGLGFCWAQDTFRFIQLNDADYYLSYAPVRVEWATLLLINAGTLLITLLFLLIPSLAVTSVTPLKAIRFK